MILITLTKSRFNNKKSRCHSKICRIIRSLKSRRYAKTHKTYKKTPEIKSLFKHSTGFKYLFIKIIFMIQLHSY